MRCSVLNGHFPWSFMSLVFIIAVYGVSISAQVPEPAAGDCYIDSPGSYKGKTHTSRRNETCLDWHDPKILVYEPRPEIMKEIRDDIQQADGYFQHNYCRNPKAIKDLVNRPWCYIPGAYNISINSLKYDRWDYCDIPICPPMTCPSSIDHGSIDPECKRISGHKCGYTCQDGYNEHHLVSTLTCLPSGQWDKNTRALCISLKELNHAHQSSRETDSAGSVVGASSASSTPPPQIISSHVLLTTYIIAGIVFVVVIIAATLLGCRFLKAAHKNHQRLSNGSSLSTDSVHRLPPGGLPYELTTPMSSQFSSAQSPIQIISSPHILAASGSGAGGAAGYTHMRHSMLAATTSSPSHSGTRGAAVAPPLAVKRSLSLYENSEAVDQLNGDRNPNYSTLRSTLTAAAAFDSYPPSYCSNEKFSDTLSSNYPVTSTSVVRPTLFGELRDHDVAATMLRRHDYHEHRPHGHASLGVTVSPPLRQLPAAAAASRSTHLPQQTHTNKAFNDAPNDNTRGGEYSRLGRTISGTGEKDHIDVDTLPLGACAANHNSLVAATVTSTPTAVAGAASAPVTSNNCGDDINENLSNLRREEGGESRN